MKRCTTALASAALVLEANGQVARAADAQQLQLLNRIIGGMKCEETMNNGRICDYSVGKLVFSIKGIGGADTVIGFRHSDIEDELYAVMYFGCVTVVPGKAHPRNYSLAFGVHVSPMTGNVYATSEACSAASARSAK
jgi:hypothetical protein